MRAGAKRLFLLGFRAPALVDPDGDIGAPAAHLAHEHGLVAAAQLHRGVRGGVQQELGADLEVLDDLEYPVVL